MCGNQPLSLDIFHKAYTKVANYDSINKTGSEEKFQRKPWDVHRNLVEKIWYLPENRKRSILQKLNHAKR